MTTLTATTPETFATTTARRPCPVCSGAAVEVLHHQRFVLFDDVPFPSEYDVVQCVGCGMAYADVPAPQAVFDAFYRDHSRYHSAPTEAEPMTAEWERRRMAQTARTITDFLGFRNARILDVGCANGTTLAALKELGYRNLTGLDPSAACAQKVCRSVGCRAEVGTLADHPALGKFDLVILSHTLEHIHDVQGAALALHDLLTVSGAAYVEVPDASRYVEILGVPFQDFNTEHINHFDAPRLQRAMAGGGLGLVEYGARTFPSPPPYPFPAVFGFFRRGLGRQPERAFFENHLGEKLRQYIERSRATWDAAEARLLSELAGRKPIIWGAGETTLKLLAGPLGQLGIAAIVDGNPAYLERRLMGHKVFVPKFLKTDWVTMEGKILWKASEHHDTPIVAASTLHRESIFRQIKTLGLPNPVLSFSFPPPAGWEEE